MDRNLQIGKLYKAPWKVAYYEASNDPEAHRKRFYIPDGAYVVLLEVDDDNIKILDSNGNIGWIWSFTNDFSGYFELVKE